MFFQINIPQITKKAPSVKMGEGGSVKLRITYKKSKDYKWGKCWAAY